jgi:tRNA pseudouridine38-40 synthase
MGTVKDIRKGQTSAIGRGRRRKYRATIQYVGSRYQGWQIQPDSRTVQGVLSEILSRLAGEPVTVVGAGRTDSGVHALGQVAHFYFREKASIPNLQKTMNALLPDDIRIVRLRPVAASFHAQRDALLKRYEYRIFTGPVLSPFLTDRICHCPGPLEADRMKEAASMLIGSHDFTSFTAAASRVRNRRRELTRSEVRRSGNTITYRVEGRGFLHHMVRNIAGTLIEIGQGKRASQEIATILEARDRSAAGPTAPAAGLYMVRIWY